VPNGNVEYAILDLADLSSIRSFSEEMKKKEPVVDVLVNNAGHLCFPVSA